MIMEHDDYLLDSFSSSMIQQLNEILIDKNCVSHSFRKYSVKNEKDVEFSFILKSAIDSISEDKFNYPLTKSSCLTEEELNSLKLVSQSWCLHLTDVFIKESSLYLKLNRPQVFFAVINSILSKKSDFGRNATCDQVVNITWENGGNSSTDLTSYRLHLLRKAVENCLRAAGYRSVNDSSSNEWIHFSTKNHGETGKKAENDRKKPRMIVCGPVLNVKTRTKETETTVEEYRRLRFQDLQTASEGRNPELKTVEKLTDASIKLIFLQTKATQPICLDFDGETGKNRETGSKGGTFLLYNLSRLASIREKYSRGVEDGLYPVLGSPDAVDFSLLTHLEEWALLFNFLLEYPSLVRKCGEEIVGGRPAIHKICKFLFSLCSTFSVYYRKDRILQKPKEHLVPLLKARLFLAMSIEQVLENGLNLLDVEKVQYM